MKALVFLVLMFVAVSSGAATISKPFVLKGKVYHGDKEEHFSAFVVKTEPGVASFVMVPRHAVYAESTPQNVSLGEPSSKAEIRALKIHELSLLSDLCILEILPMETTSDVVLTEEQIEIGSAGFVSGYLAGSMMLQLHQVVRGYDDNWGEEPCQTYSSRLFGRGASGSPVFITNEDQEVFVSAVTTGMDEAGMMLAEGINKNTLNLVKSTINQAMNDEVAIKYQTDGESYMLIDGARFVSGEEMKKWLFHLGVESYSDIEDKKIYLFSDAPGAVNPDGLGEFVPVKAINGVATDTIRAIQDFLTKGPYYLRIQLQNGSCVNLVKAGP